jgi:hypothetical protein
MNTKLAVLVCVQEIYLLNTASMPTIIMTIGLQLREDTISSTAAIK